MLPHSHAALPKIRDSISYLYLEKGRLEQTKHGVDYVNKAGRVQIPIANLTTLMLGPGTSVTHAAIRSLARVGCLVEWVGEQGVRFYAQGLGETRKSYKLMRQAELVSDEKKRIAVVRRMYEHRFQSRLEPGLTLEQIRGKEGMRVRHAYQQAAAEYGIEWHGRNYDRHNWNAGDTVNRALSAANACLTAVCHSAIVSAGYAPGLGFIHQGTQSAFVYDIADLYKTKLTVPIAFETAAEVDVNIEGSVRKRCRESFRNMKLLARVIPDIELLLDLDKDLDLVDGFDPDFDPAFPTPWWKPSGDGWFSDLDVDAP